MKLLITKQRGDLTYFIAAEAAARGMETCVCDSIGDRLKDLGVKEFRPDVSDIISHRRSIEEAGFDIVLDTGSENLANMEDSLRLFKGLCKQYFYISSYQVYSMPPRSWLIDEDAPLGNIHSQSARDIIAAEKALRRAMAEGFPGVIIRPGMLYSQSDPALPLNSLSHPYTLIQHLRNGSKMVVHGDGSALCSLTHASDFAAALTRLFGMPEANGQIINISAKHIRDWNRIYEAFAAAAGVNAPIVHIPSDYIRNTGDWDDCFPSMCSHSAVLDNHKLLRLLPDFRFATQPEDGLRECVEWFDADPASRESCKNDWFMDMMRMINIYEGTEDYNF